MPSSEGPHGTSPERPSGDRRERILDVAAEEFASRGYTGASLGRVAEAADLSQPGLLYHFGSKAGLLTAVLERHEATSDALLQQATGGQTCGLPALEAFVETIGSFVAEDRRDAARLLMVLAAEAVTDRHPAADWARGRHQAYRLWLAGNVLAGVEAGDLRRTIDPYVTAASLLALAEGLLLQWLLDDEGMVDVAAALRAELGRLRSR